MSVCKDGLTFNIYIYILGFCTSEWRPPPNGVFTFSRAGAAYLLPLPLPLLLLGSLGSFMLVDQSREVGHVFIRLLQQVGQTLVFLLVDQFPVTLLIFSLEESNRRSEVRLNQLFSDSFLHFPSYSLSFPVSLCSFSQRPCLC